MVKKAVLANFIRTNPNAPYPTWVLFMPKVTGLRVKTIDSKGTVVISLDDKGWFKPIEWYHNYQADVREEMIGELSKAEFVLPTKEFKEILSQYVDLQKGRSLSRIKALAQRAIDDGPSVVLRLSALLQFLLKEEYGEEEAQQIIDMLLRSQQMR